MKWVCDPAPCEPEPPPPPVVCEPDPVVCPPEPPPPPVVCEPDPVVCPPEPPPPPVVCEPDPVVCPPEPPPPPVVCEPDPVVCPPEPPPPVICEPPAQNAGNTGNSTNTISSGGDAGDVTAGNGTYVSTDAGGGLLNISLLNGLGGSNILSPSIGGPSLGLGAILENDMAGNSGNSLFGSLFGGNGGNTGDSANTVSSGGDAGDVTAGDGTYVSTDAGGGLLNVSLLNGLGGSNILSPSVGGPSLGVGAIFENDTAGDGGNSLIGSLFGGNDGGDTGDSTNTVSSGGDAGDVTTGDGTYVSTDTGSGLLNVSLLNGLGGSNILSPSVGGPSLGVGAIFENDTAGDGGNSLFGSLFGGNDGGDTGDSINTVSSGGDAGDVTTGDGTYVSTDTGSGLLNVSLLNGLGGSNILSPSVGGPSLGVGAIFENDTAGDGGNSLIGSLFGGNDGGDTGDSINTVSSGGDAGNVSSGDGTYVVSGGEDGIGGLIKAALLNGAGGSNILSPSVGGPSLGVGAIFENDTAGDAYDGHVPLAGVGDVLPDIGAALDLITSAHQLFDLPMLDIGSTLGDLNN